MPSQIVVHIYYPYTLDNDVKTPACTLLSNRGARLQHDTGAITYPCRHLSRRRIFFFIITDKNSAITTIVH